MKKEKTVNNSLEPNYKQNKKYYKTSNPDSVGSMIWTLVREYLIFWIPMFAAYLPIYYVTIQDGYKDKFAWVYILVGMVLIIVDLACYFLRRLIRKNRFDRYCRKEIPIYKGNKWKCPLCVNENNSLNYCKKCGVLPTFYKGDDKAATFKYKGKSRKKQKEYDKYTPQF